MSGPFRAASRAVVLGCFLFLAGCVDAASTGPAADPVADLAHAKGGKPGGSGGGGATADPIVDGTNPSEAPRDTTLDVEVVGDNFEPGSVAEFLLDEATTAHVTTNETRYVNSRRLIANVTVSAEAATELYDVRVTTPPGRKGVGLEIFEITEGSVPLAVTLGGSSLSDDGGGPYLHGSCAVRAAWDVGTYVYLVPRVSLNKRDERAMASDPACEGIFPRSAFVHLADAPVRSYCVAPATREDCSPAEKIVPTEPTTIAQLAAAGIVDPPDPSGVPVSQFGLRLTDAGRDGDPTTSPGGLNPEYCLDDGSGRPTRFDPERSPNSHELRVTYAADGRPTRAETQPYPNNVASCAHTRSDGTLVVLNVELDVVLEYSRLD